MKIIGLTGSIGSGKSTVRTLLQERGAVVIDADKVGHEIYRQNSLVWSSIVEAWGPDILQPNKEINRSRLGSIVFSDPNELEKLNRLVHPAIREEVEKRLETERVKNTTVVVLEAAILIETGWNDLVDEVWLVKANSEIVAQRLKENRGLTSEQIRMRQSRQMPAEDKMRYSDVVIENNGNASELRSTLDVICAGKFGSGGNPERSVQ